MRLYRRQKSNGEWVWWASWTQDGRTVRHSTKCTTKAAAELVVARWEREHADPVYAAAQNATFGEEASRFLRACEGAVERKKMAPDTLGMYRQKAGTLCRILEARGPLRLAVIDGATFEEYLATRRAEFFEDRGRPISESNLYKEWVTFRQILKGAWRAQRFNRDPGSLKPEHFGVEYTPRDTFLTEVQADALLAQLQGDRRRTVAFVLATGARRREWQRAVAGDIDLKGRSVHLRGTKTKTADRVIPLLNPTMRWARLAGQPPFPAWGNARRDIHLACDKAGIPRVTWNDLRRTFASRLALAGIQSDVGRRLMGHGSEQMWNLVYARASTEGLREMAERQLRDPTVNQTKRTQARKDKAKRT